MIRVALIGISGYGQTHLRLIEEQVHAGRLRLASVVAPSGTPDDALAQAHALGARVYPDFATWLEAERGAFDLCFLPIPIHLHASMASAVLDAGASVMVEKPLAASAEDIATLLAARPAPGRFVAVGFQDLHLPEAHSLRSAFSRGDYGALRSMSVLGLWSRGESYYGRNSWAGRLRVANGMVLDSPLNNAFAHFVMLPLFLASRAPDEAAQPFAGEAELYRTRQIESFDTAALRLRLPGDVTLQVHVTHRCEGEEDPVIQLVCEKAVIRWTANRDIRIRWHHGAETRHPLPDLAATRRHHFLSLCRRAQGEDVWVCPPAIAAAHSRLVVALHAALPIHDLAPATHASIADTLRDSLSCGRLPSESAANWARPAMPFVIPGDGRVEPARIGLAAV